LDTQPSIPGKKVLQMKSLSAWYTRLFFILLQDGQEGTSHGSCNDGKKQVVCNGDVFVTVGLWNKILE